MTTTLSTNKTNHERLATDAVRAGQFTRAVGHTAKAAEIGFILAERSEGLIARRRLEDAMALVEMVEQLKARVAELEAPAESA